MKSVAEPCSNDILLKFFTATILMKQELEKLYPFWMT